MTSLENGDDVILVDVFIWFEIPGENKIVRVNQRERKSVREGEGGIEKRQVETFKCKSHRHYKPNLQSIFFTHRMKSHFSMFMTIIFWSGFL